jgi:group I intron endonuclease
LDVVYNNVFLTIINTKIDCKISNQGQKLINLVLKRNSWPFIEKNKKHTYVEHCSSFSKDHNLFQKKWLNLSGIYKITFLPIKMFTYIGSSKKIGQRIKYHYYNGSKQNNFLGLFIKEFGWSFFSVTLIEKCNFNEIQKREDWYLNKFKPLLNYMTKSYSDPRKIKGTSVLTKNKISETLLGKKHSLDSRIKMSKSRTGVKNYYFGKRLSFVALERARLVRGIKIYVYNAKDFSLVNNIPFPSVRTTVKSLPISATTLKNKLDKGTPFKGYLYFSSSQNKPD